MSGRLLEQRVIEQLGTRSLALIYGNCGMMGEILHTTVFRLVLI